MRGSPSVLSERPNGLILVAHEVLKAITQEEMLAALPAGYEALPREVIHLRSFSVNHSELAGADWGLARRGQEDDERQIQAAIAAHPTWRVQYFGAAPIPAAMCLGHFVGGMVPLDVYQQRHDTNTWEWTSAARSPKMRFRRYDLPRDRLSAEGDILLRVSISHRIDATDTAEVVPRHLGDFAIELVAPNEDVLQSLADVDAVIERFDQFIDWAHEFRPNTRIHVFAAVPVGVAFRLGTRINPTIHSPVQTYQFSKSASPRYIKALVLQERTEQLAPLTAEELEAAALYRVEIAGELSRIQDAARELQRRDQQQLSRNWLTALFPEVDSAAFCGPILTLKKIHETRLNDSAVDMTVTSVADGFRFDDLSRSWQLDDRLLLTISRRFNDSADARQAGRLLLLHEGVHLASHGLTEATAGQIRRFPKIVEEVDYQADTWAFLHEFALNQLLQGEPSLDSRRAFQQIIQIALETFWAFDERADHERIEIRRLNRYLIWYWQQLRVEKCASLPEILNVLGSRPLIEIAGPRIYSSENRVFYSLDPNTFDEPELGVLFDQRVIRYGHAPGSRVKDILVGFRERDGSKIRWAAKTIFDQLWNQP